MVSKKQLNLTNFLNKYGTQTTNNFQLIKYAKELGIPNFHVCMRDELKELQLTCNVICNIHTSDQKGVHWSALRISPHDATYFDSYGLPPTQEILDLCSHIKHKITYSGQLQEFGTSYCGQLCLYVLYCLNKSIPFETIVEEIKNVIM